LVDLTAQYDDLINLIEIKGLKYPTIIVDALSRIRALSASILRRVGTWAANTGNPPHDDPMENDYWVVDTAGTYLLQEYEIGDWCVWTTVEGWSKIGNQGIGGGVVYRGTYDAFVEPSYPVGAFKGDFYVISAAGDLDGDDYNAMDWIVYNGVTWDWVDNSVSDIILDDAYPVGWDTDTTHTASRNAIFDAIVAAIGAGGHLHDTDVLELDGIDSDGGAFPFDTTGAVTFNQAVIIEGLLTADGVVPEADLADSLGTAALTWLNLYVQDIFDAAGNQILGNDGAGKIDAIANISAAVIMESTLAIQGLTTANGIVPQGDLADDLGTNALTWLNLYVQDIRDAAGNQILGTDGAAKIDALANISSAVVMESTLEVQGLATVDGLVPEADLADSLGTAALTWLELYVQDLKDAAGNIVFSNDGAGKIDALGNISAAVIMESTLEVQGLATVDGLVPEADLSDDLGSAALTWLSLYIQDIYDAAGNQIFGTDGAGKIDFVAEIDADITMTALRLVDGVDISVFETSFNNHLHDGQTLQFDNINSDDGAFSFSTTGAVTFNQSIILDTAAVIDSANEDLIFLFGRGKVFSGVADEAMFTHRDRTNEYVSVNEDGLVNIRSNSGQGIQILIDAVVEFGFFQNTFMLGENGLQFKSQLSNGEYSGVKATVTVDDNNFGFGAALFMAADGHYEECDADNEADMPCTALALDTGTGIKEVLLFGYICESDWAFDNAGDVVYVSTAEGDLTTTRPSGSGDQVQRVGIAVDTTILYFNPSLDVGQVL